MTEQIVRRIERTLGLDGLREALVRRLPGSDLQSLLLAVVRGRAEASTAADARPPAGASWWKATSSTGRRACSAIGRSAC